MAKQAQLALESVEISALQSAKYLMDVCAALQPAAAPAVPAAPAARADKVAPDQLTFPSASATAAAAAVPPPVEQPSPALADGVAHVASVADAAKVVTAMRAPAPALAWPAPQPQPQPGSAWRGGVPQQAAARAAAAGPSSPTARSSSVGAGLASPSAQPARPSGASAVPGGAGSAGSAGSAGGAGGAGGAAEGAVRTPVMAELLSFLSQQGREAVSSEAVGGGEGSGQRAPEASSSLARDGGGSGAASGAASSASGSGGGGDGGGTPTRAPSGLVLDSGGQAGAQASAAPQPSLVQAVERLRAAARPGAAQAEAATLAQGGGMPRAPRREDGIERHARRHRAGSQFEKSLSGSLNMVEL